MQAQKPTLGETTAYTPTTCFETFPFPQMPNPKLVQEIGKLPSIYTSIAASR